MESTHGSSVSSTWTNSALAGFEHILLCYQTNDRTNLTQRLIGNIYTVQWLDEGLRPHPRVFTSFESRCN